MILRFFRPDPRRALAEALYDRIAAAARVPSLYLHAGVPDTVEGRFEALVLHVVLVLRRLRELPEPAGDVAQELVDCVFRRLDGALREMGVGDMSIPKRMKKLAGSFYGRADAYGTALDAGDREALVRALARNVTGEERQELASRLADYTLAGEQSLSGASLDDLLADGTLFPLPPSSEGRHDTESLGS